MGCFHFLWLVTKSNSLRPQKTATVALAPKISMTFHLRFAFHIPANLNKHKWGILPSTMVLGLRSVTVHSKKWGNDPLNTSEKQHYTHIIKKMCTFHLFPCNLRLLLPKNITVKCPYVFVIMWSICKFSQTVTNIRYQIIWQGGFGKASRLDSSKTAQMHEPAERKLSLKEALKKELALI